MYSWFTDFLSNMIYSFNVGYEFLMNPIANLGGVNVSILTIVTLTGLLAYLGIAIIRWFI